jgi:MarR family transcriptional regulator, lower aerobic nicotinate degradation pathway regulator
MKPTKNSRAAPHPYVLEEQVGHLLRRAHQRHCGIFAEGIESRLTPMQFAALCMIAEQDRISQNHLGRLTAMDPATTQGVVKRMSERGLIVADDDPDDRRRSVWRLTPKGRRLLTNLLPKGRQISADTLEPLTVKERQTFLRLLKKLA